MTRQSCRFAFLFATCVVAAPLRAQQDTVRGVRIGLTYDPSTKPGLVVLPITGAMGDSVRTIVTRDLDFSDRIVVVPVEGSSAATFRQGNGSLNYALFAKLGAVGVV